MEQILECVPNFSEGQNLETLQLIEEAIRLIPNVKLLHKDVGFSANRTVFTFAGEPNAVIEAAFQAIKVASENIDMTKHKGTHPRMGACDVCPIIPVKGITMKEAIELSNLLATRVCDELNIPVYLYEESAKNEERIKLENIRKGEFEAITEKLKSEHWRPDYLPNSPNLNAGATVIGAREFLIAYNINLNTEDLVIAKLIAKELRQLRTNKLKQKHNLSRVKAIGWFIPEFNKCQISTNITDYKTTPLTLVYKTVKSIAKKHNISVTGSELIGLIPKNALIESGELISKSSQSEKEYIETTVKQLIFSDLQPFNPQKRIIEALIDS